MFLSCVTPFWTIWRGVSDAFIISITPSTNFEIIVESVTAPIGEESMMILS